MESASATGISPSRHAALFVLAHLANQESPISIAEMAKLTGLHRASLYRTIESLESEGWVTCEGQPRRYAIALRFTQLGLRSLRNNQARQALLPFATELCLKLRTPTNVSFYEDGDIVVTDSIALVNGIAVQFAEGVRIPATCQGSGKILLSQESMDEIDRVLARPLPQYTERTKTDPVEILEDLQIARDRGWGWGFGEFGSRLGTVGFAVQSRSDGAVGAIGFIVGRQYESGPTEEMLHIARQITDRASAQFGFRPAFLDH